MLGAPDRGLDFIQEFRGSPISLHQHGVLTVPCLEPSTFSATMTFGQRFAVVVDGSQYGGADAELTLETPFVPRLNE
jgi:hypothetical protein